MHHAPIDILDFLCNQDGFCLAQTASMTEDDLLVTLERCDHDVESTMKSGVGLWVLTSLPLVCSASH
jgi:hypothetical protein